MALRGDNLQIIYNSDFNHRQADIKYRSMVD